MSGRAGNQLVHSPEAEAILCTTSADVNTDLVDLVFAGPVIEWRGPAPFYFVPLPDEEAASIREVAAIAMYGWGVIPVEARIGEVAFTTSLFPKDGGYLVPIKALVQRAEQLDVGDTVTIRLEVDAPER